MTHVLKRLSFRNVLSAALVACLPGTTVAEVAPQPSPQPSRAPCPCRVEGLAFGMGAGVKLLNLKNIATKTTPDGVSQRSGDSFANTSSPVISVYARKYLPDFLFIPSFLGLEFNYLTSMRKTSIYTNLNNVPGLTLDTGYRYRERWDARAMLGAQLWSGPQLDLWAQLGLQVTNFDYEGRTTEATGGLQVFKMNENYALSPAVGLEVRYSEPRLVGHGVVTDFIVGWTAGYRNAFTVTETSIGNSTFNIAMNSNWSHTFGLKVLFRY